MRLTLSHSAASGSVKSGGNLVVMFLRVSMEDAEVECGKLSIIYSGWVPVI